MTCEFAPELCIAINSIVDIARGILINEEDVEQLQTVGSAPDACCSWSSNEVSLIEHARFNFGHTHAHNTVA